MSLRYAADRRSLAFIGSYFALVAAAYSTSMGFAGNALLVMTLCLVSFLCAVITHNTVHAPMFRSRVANRVVQVLLTLTYGHPVSAYVPGHNLSHHRYTQTQRDLMRTSKVAFKWNWLNQLLFAWKVGPPIFAANLRFASRMKSRRKRWYRQLVLETCVLLAFVVLAFVLDWKKAFLFVVLPHQYAAWGIMGINYVQHDGCDADSPYNHSRNFTGRLVNWLTFNNGFHGIHHMKPSLHWSLLREAHARELAPHVHPALDQPSFPAYLFRAYIWPGTRASYLGDRFEPAPVGEDEDWIPNVVTLDESDLGAAA